MNELAYFRPAVEWDINFIAPFLRQEDKNTIKWMTDMSAHDGLQYSFNNSIESNSIVVNHKVVGMFGIAGSSEEACPWMLMTDFLKQPENLTLHRLFLIESRKWIEDRKWHYKKLFNFVSQTHEEHIKWIEWLGFNIMDLYPEFGPYKKPFLYFEMKGYK